MLDLLDTMVHLPDIMVDLPKTMNNFSKIIQNLSKIIQIKWVGHYVRSNMSGFIPNMTGFFSKCDWIFLNMAGFHQME